MAMCFTLYLLHIGHGFVSVVLIAVYEAVLRYIPVHLILICYVLLRRLVVELRRSNEIQYPHSSV